MARCKACKAAEAKVRRADKNERDPQGAKQERRKENLKRFKLTPEEHDKMIEAQGNKCAICGRGPEQSGRWGTLHIDHDHACCTGKGKNTCGGCTRELLCSNCNTMLGLAADNREIFLAAVKYLDKWSA